MFKTLLFVGSLALLLQSCVQGESHGSGTAYGAGGGTTMPEAQRASLLRQEQSAPQEYLRVEGTYRRSAQHQLVLEGDITNHATLATFKDPVLSVTWYSKANTELATKVYPVYELVRPQDSAHFQLQADINGPVASVAMGVSGAMAIE